MDWKRVAPLAEIQSKPFLFKLPPRQIALFRVNGRVFAVDNRCPHEGYPLVAGSVDDSCVLTCNWHNWKFRLDDGRCILGGDDVRSYPVEIRDGDVWVDVRQPPAEEILAGILDGFERAFRKREFGRLCREISRLHYNKLDPLIAVRQAVRWSHDRFEFGFTHAYAAAADWLEQFDAYAGDWEKQLICLAEAVDHMAFDSLRQPSFEFSGPAAPFDSATFATTVEGERREQAEGMVRQALEDGLHWQDLEEAFIEAALAHYNDFGHSLIFVQKAARLLELLGPELEPFVCLPLTRSLCYATREDLLPEFKNYATELRDLPEPAARDQSPLDASDLFPSNLPEAFSWLRRNAPDHAPLTLHDALLEANARNLLRFDSSYQSAFDRPVADSAGWLDFTHGITFANAVRTLCSRHPRFWRQGLLQMACFLGRNRRYLDVDLDESRWLVGDRDVFLADIRERILDHGLNEPIFSSHLLKTAKAVEAELPHASPSCQEYLLAALNRFFHSPLKQKHVRRKARQAIDLVRRDFD